MEEEHNNIWQYNRQFVISKKKNYWNTIDFKYHHRNEILEFMPTILIQIIVIASSCDVFTLDQLQDILE